MNVNAEKQKWMNQSENWFLDKTTVSSRKNLSENHSFPTDKNKNTSTIKVQVRWHGFCDNERDRWEESCGF